MRLHALTRPLMMVLTGSMLLSLFMAPCQAAELDDSNLFVEAFNAYQKKDYLLAMDKVEQLTQVFPDSPLRDISLLLLARAGLKSGNNEVAAKAINQFTSEYKDNSLKTTVEEELLALGARRKKGEKLLPNKQLMAAAQKVRNDQLAQEHAAAVKAEQERLAKEKAERERIALAKAEAERKERERIAAEKAAKAAIKLAIALPEGSQQLEAGKKVLIPFAVSNTGTGREEFLLSAQAPKEYALALTAADKPGVLIERVALAPGEQLKGNIAVQIPSDKVDGSKAAFHITAASTRYSDVTFSRDMVVTTSAPLVRAISKPQKTKVSPGETVRYRVTLLNAGSVTAHGLTVRAIIPAQLDFVDAAGADFRREADGSVSYLIPSLEMGRLAEYNLDLKVKDNVAAKQELRVQIEVFNTPLQLRETFTSSAAVVQGK